MPQALSTAILKPIESAPTDGTIIYVINPQNNKLWLVAWEADGDSLIGGKIVVTGVWMCQDESGWFEPGEVLEWLTVDEVQPCNHNS
jgi:hypothetical protein